MSKTFKKVAGLLLAMAMVIGMLPSAAMAAPTWGTETEGSITINKKDQKGDLLAGVEYTIYKVADLEQDASGMKYTSLVTGVTVTGDTTAADFTDAQLATCASKTSTTSNGVDALKFENLELGVYVVKETKRPTGVIAANNFIISVPMTDPTNQDSWIYDVVVDPKNTVFDGSVDKTLNTDLDQFEPGHAAVNIGDELDYTVSVTMPTDFYGTAAGAKEYTQFDVTDTPSTGLKLVPGTIVVKVAGNVITLPADCVVENTLTNGFTVKFVKDGAPAAVEIEAGAVIDITYTAVITKEAIDNSPVKNAIEITYDYPGTEEPGTVTPEEPDPENPDPDPNPELHTYSHAAYKVAGTPEAALNGAEFVLQLENGKYIAQKVDEDGNAVEGWMEVADIADACKFVSGTASQFATFTEDGYFSIIGIKGGANKLIETKAPAGYTLLKTAVNVTFDDATTAVERGVEANQSLAYTTKIVNVKGFELPGTGEGGIYLYILGGIVLLGAALMLYSKSRKSVLAK